MNFLILLISLVYSYPGIGGSKPRDLASILAKDIELRAEEAGIKVYRMQNFHIIGSRRTEIFAPERVFKEKVKRLVTEKSIASTISGLPRGRKVKFTVHNGGIPGKYVLISEEVDLKSYRRNVATGKFGQDFSKPVKTHIKLTGYKKGDKFIITDEISFPKGVDLEVSKVELDTDFTGTLNLETATHYPSAIANLNFVHPIAGSDQTKFYSIVPPATFWDDTGRFFFRPLGNWNTLDTINVEENGRSFLDVEMELHATGESYPNQVRITFAVVRQKDHIQVIGIEKIKYPSDAARRFVKDKELQSKKTLDDAAKKFNEQVFGNYKPSVAIGVPQETVVEGIPSTPIAGTIQGASGSTSAQSKPEEPLITLDGNPELVSLIDRPGSPRKAIPENNKENLIELGKSSSNLDPFNQPGSPRKATQGEFQSKHQNDITPLDILHSPSGELERIISSHSPNERQGSTLKGLPTLADPQNAQILAEFDSKPVKLIVGLIPSLIAHPQGKIEREGANPLENPLAGSADANAYLAWLRENSLAPEAPIQPPLVNLGSKKKLSPEELLKLAGARQSGLEDLNPLKAGAGARAKPPKPMREAAVEKGVNSAITPNSGPSTGEETLKVGDLADFNANPVGANPIAPESPVKLPEVDSDLEKKPTAELTGEKKVAEWRQ